MYNRRMYNSFKTHMYSRHMYNRHMYNSIYNVVLISVRRNYFTHEFHNVLL